MPSTSSTASVATQATTAQAVIHGLLRCGITSGFGIPSIHNIALYDALRQEPGFHHWIVRHEQAAVFAADGHYRRSGRTAAVFASTGPGNLFTVAPLLESFQTNTPLVVIGTNVASQMLGLALGRYVLRFGPLAEATPEELAAAIGPTIDRYLTGDIGGEAET